MKKYIAASIILLVGIIASSFWLINRVKEDMRICHSDVVWIKDNGTADGIMLKSKMSLQIADNHSGRINFYGYIKNQTVVYRLDRAIYFEYNAIDNKGHYSIQFQSSSVTSSDNTPNEVFSNFVQLEQDKIKYFISVIRMTDNIYILKDEAYTSFTCYVE